MKKIGIIRCQQTEDMCPGTADFKVVKEGKLAFEEIGPGEVVGFVSCGGCPGKRIIKRAEMLIERGAEVIAFASCMKKGTPIGFPCPHFEQIKSVVQKRLDGKAILIDWTH